MPQGHRPSKWRLRPDASTTTIAGLFILMVLVGLASPPRSSAGGNVTGKIAFARGSGAAQEIYVMNADGSGQTRVTNNAVADYFPVISPDGSKIAFESERSGNRDIYVIDPDGTNELRLTTALGLDLHPAWSPDGKHIAWSSDQNGNRDIYVMDSDGANQRRVTIHPGPDLHPVYSLDGTKFFFASERDGDREIFTIGSDVIESESEVDCASNLPCGVVPVRLTDNRSFDSYPALSPDGSKIVFHSLRDGNFEIYVMGIHGENQTNLTRNSTEDIFPNWSPNGTKIVFESLRGGNRDIYVMDANGNNQTRLTTDAAQDLIPAWHWARTTTPKTISGRVRGTGGGVVVDLKINVSRVADASAIPACVVNDTFVRTLADGTYSIQVTPGCSYTVEPDSQELFDRFGGTGVARPTSLDVFVGLNVPGVDFVAGATPSPSIVGRIIDGTKCPNYNPGVDDNLDCGLPGVTVTGEWTGETRTDVSKPINADPTISGRYTLPTFLTNSVVRVRASLPGYVITMIPPNTEQITLTNVSRFQVDLKAMPVNNAPAVSLVDPANGTTFPPAPQISINANASDADGLVSKVEFFQGTTKLGEDTGGPYNFTWNGAAPGNYSLTAVATDNGGASTTSSPINITVSGPPTLLQFNSATFSQVEAGGTAIITVTRSGGSANAASVQFSAGGGGSATGGTACSAGVDYVSTSGTLNWAAGDASNKTFAITICNDTTFEGNETVNLALSNASGATLGTPSTATLTVTDDDSQPTISINDVSLAEGNSGATNFSFIVSLSNTTTQTVTVNYATANGTATAGSDYQAVNASLTFSPGDSSKPLTVQVNGDTLNEADESFVVNLSSAVNATILDNQGGCTILNDDVAGLTVQFSSPNYDVTENGVAASVIVSRSGNTSSVATVAFTTGDVAGLANCNVANTGAASSRCDYETTIGTLRFAANETSKTIFIPIIDDSYDDNSESFTVTLSGPTGATLGSPTTATVNITDNDDANGANPINQVPFFVRLHYIDFLNREPDSSGLAFWSNQITSCGNDAACIELKRINVSAAFFISIEFQETGYLVYRIYKAAHGNLTGLPVPVRFNEFLPDTQQIGQGVVVGDPGYEQVLENNKLAFVNEFVARGRFISDHPTTDTPMQFVDELLLNAGVQPSTTERQLLIDEFGGSSNTVDLAARARVLRRVAEHSLLRQQEFNKAFVLMQYFGYLRRNPNDPPELTLDFQGYQFWLNKLSQFNGNFVNAEMVKAFILSGEYQQRFGP